MNRPFDLLLGRKTFEIWEQYWPHHADIWPEVNTATKYVASNTRTSSTWQPSVFLNGDIAGKIAGIKQQQGPDLQVWGSANLAQTLMQHDLIDSFWLMIFPITLGGGKKLFADGAIPAAFRVTENEVTPNGVIVVNYERAGAVTAGSVYTTRPGQRCPPVLPSSREQIFPHRLSRRRHRRAVLQQRDALQEHPYLSHGGPDKQERQNHCA